MGRTEPEADLSATVPQRDALIWSSRKVGGQAVLPGDNPELTTGRNVASEKIADERSESTKELYGLRYKIVVERKIVGRWAGESAEV